MGGGELIGFGCVGVRCRITIVGMLRGVAEEAICLCYS